MSLKAFLGKFALLYGRHGSSEEFRVDASHCLVVQSVAVVLDSDRLVLERDRILLDFVLLQELEERLISEHLGHFQLVLVPILCQRCLDIANVHVEELPVRLCASLADESAECDVEVRALLLAAIDAESVEGVLDQQRLYQLGLLGRLPLEDGNGRWHLRWRNELEVRVGRQLLVRLLVKLGFPGGEQVLGKLSSFKRRHCIRYRHLRLSHWCRLVPSYLSSRLQRCAWLRHVRMCELL